MEKLGQTAPTTPTTPEPGPQTATPSLETSADGALTLRQEESPRPSGRPRRERRQEINKAIKEDWKESSKWVIDKKTGKIDRRDSLRERFWRMRQVGKRAIGAYLGYAKDYLTGNLSDEYEAPSLAEAEATAQETPEPVQESIDTTDTDNAEKGSAPEGEETEDENESQLSRIDWINLDTYEFSDPDGSEPLFSWLSRQSELNGLDVDKAYSELIAVFNEYNSGRSGQAELSADDKDISGGLASSIMFVARTKYRSLLSV